MTPENILIAATELITEIDANSKPANEIINTYTRARRYIGSKDRRALTDLVWYYLRHRARLDFCYPNSNLADKLTIIQPFCDSKCLQKSSDFCHAEMPTWVRYETPDWLIPLIPNADTELPALLESAPIVLRANGDRTKIQKQLSVEGIETIPTPLSPFGLILTKRTNLAASPTFQSGRVEIQDEGSQLVGLETNIKPGDSVLDYCAGAGGKSLLFAQMMNNSGSIVAHDISARSLSELEKRADRANIKIIHTVNSTKQIMAREWRENRSAKPQMYTKNTCGFEHRTRPLNCVSESVLFDHVVVDAPCSGVGTWRRCPDARWKLTQNQLAQLVDKQKSILDQSSIYVKPNGFLSYMTCSLTNIENEKQATDFLITHPNFKLIKQKQFSPAQTNTDGLFIAQFQKIA